MEKYDTMTDEQLIRRLRGGEAGIIDYIMEKYKDTVRRKARETYLLGGETEDLIQEGMIGLFKAVRDFDPDQGTSFAGFAKLCISRQMYTAIKLSQRKKHIPLNSYVSLYEEKKDEEPLITRLRAERNSDPEEIFLDKEYVSMLERELESRLSDLEKKVLHLYLVGEDYRSIASLLNKSPKSIDNALQRIRQKIAPQKEKL